MVKDISERLKQMLAEGRINQKKSYAQPNYYYGNPANHIKFESEKNCFACIHSREKKDGNKFCAENQQYGKRCQLFSKVKK